ncbi:hypothetical protein IW261DRAFT_1422828 [Armillaria novae-zelandiae]|uniref:Uncharacterized protein n=1 Tax=Armillaria novae-zelandiae TaxID=153914 RepID=A0AA39NZ17_9AGAR|nr:hypothetical protein IW261DRAFT_1422828 [Armillaria novae-zelandiae]
MSINYLRCLGNDYKVLYDTILEHQKKSEFSAQVSIPKVPYFAEDVDAIGYIDEQLNFFPEGDNYSDSIHANAPGLMADLKLADRNPSVGCCSGKFLMHRSWTQSKCDGSIVELFQGCFDVSLSYGESEYNNHACHISSVFGFWAVRVRKDEDGDEIGIELGSIEDGGHCIGF